MKTPDEFVPFEPVEHTADLAYIVRGRSLEELFENAATGMMSFLIDPASVEIRLEERVEVAGEDAEECLIGWLQELIYLEEVRGRIYREFVVQSAGPPLLRALCRGEILDASRHELHTDIKAATYHDLRIRYTEGPAGGLFEVRIVLDI